MSFFRNYVKSIWKNTARQEADKIHVIHTAKHTFSFKYKEIIYTASNNIKNINLPSELSLMCESARNDPTQRKQF